MMRTLFIVLSLLISLPVFAQPADDRLANEYMRTGQYDKALIYFEELYKQSGRNDYLNNYTECLVQLNEVDKAIQVQKKAYKAAAYNGVYGVRLGQLYLLAEDEKEANKVWSDCIKRLDANQSNIVSVARAFVAIGQNQYGLEAYQHGQDVVRGRYAYSYEIAELYGAMGRYEEMIDVYLGLIEANPGYIQTVQNMIGRNFDLSEPSEANDVLKERILIKVQKNPENIIYGELIIWYYYQVGDYYSAFAQTKALDRRMDSGGQRVLNFARTSYNNKRYALAVEGYQYVLDNGRSGAYRDRAQIELLSCKYAYYEEINASGEEWTQLELDFIAVEQQYATANIGEIKRKHAAVLAEHVDRYKEAVTLLDNLIQEPRLPEKERALAKIQLADYLLLGGEVWDAALYYMQAEKEFKYEETGDLAKFKTAKLAYYTGDFLWAKAQLDVLKGSTSKLIANDAMDLSAFIDDNSAFDSVYTALEIYARADLLKSQKHFEEASATLDTLESQFPEHRILDDSYFLRYEIAKAQGDDSTSVQHLYKITNQDSEEILVDKAWYLIGVIQEEKLGNSTLAQEAYEKVIFEHPDSLYIVDARKRYRQLRGDSL